LRNLFYSYFSLGVTSFPSAAQVFTASSAAASKFDLEGFQEIIVLEIIVKL
jgi:hypothetical protein